MKAVKSILHVFLVWLLLLPASAQLDTRPIPPQKDVADLFKRVSRSDFVAAGVVTRVDGVSKRSSKKDIENRVKSGSKPGDFEVSLDGVVGGTVYRIRLDRTICRSDYLELESVNPPPRAVPPVALLFVPREESLWINGYPKEELIVGNRYLLFLRAPDAAEHVQWLNRFNLDTGPTYYRGEGRGRGIIQLSDQPTGEPENPVLEKAVQLCDALRHQGATSKLLALERLSSLDDEVIRKEAREAMKAIKERQVRNQP